MQVNSSTDTKVTSSYYLIIVNANRTRFASNSNLLDQLRFNVELLTPITLITNLFLDRQNFYYSSTNNSNINYKLSSKQRKRSTTIDSKILSFKTSNLQIDTIYLLLNYYTNLNYLFLKTNQYAIKYTNYSKLYYNSQLFQQPSSTIITYVDLQLLVTNLR